jgi:AcrR family transcriptional regulator
VYARKTFLGLSEEKRSRVVDAAVSEFSDKGYHRASINAMVGRLGIAKGSIFQYFKNKERLFLFVFEHALAVVKSNLAEVRDMSAEEPFFERLRSSLIAGVRFVEEHPRLYNIYLRIMFEGGIPFREELVEKVRRLSAKYLGSLVARGIERGEIRNDLNIETQTFILDALFDRFLQAFSMRHIGAPPELFSGAGSVEERIDELVEALRRGLMP